MQTDMTKYLTPKCRKVGTNPVGARNLEKRLEMYKPYVGGTNAKY